MHDRHTGQNLKDEVIKLLRHFRMDIWQVFSITIDNASNMVKLVQLLSKEAETSDLLELSETLPDEECTADLGDVTTTTMDEFEICANLFEGDSYEGPEEQTWAKALEECTPDEFVTTIRCGAHTAQLVVHDVCRENDFKELLKGIRKKSKKFRSAEYKAFFEVSEGTYPPLLNETRWGSDYRMILTMKTGKKFFLNLGKQYAELG